VTHNLSAIAPERYNAEVMLDTALIPDKTIITAKGDSEAVDIRGAANRVFLLTLNNTGVVEQESIEVSIFTSADGQAWSAKPALTFPQKFYREQAPMLLDLTGQKEVNFLRAHWEVNRWGRGTDTVRFEVGLKLREVPTEILAQK
jgi:hypothetical protein